MAILDGVVGVTFSWGVVCSTDSMLSSLLNFFSKELSSSASASIFDWHSGSVSPLTIWCDTMSSEKLLLCPHPCFEQSKWKLHRDACAFNLATNLLMLSPSFWLMRKNVCQWTSLFTPCNLFNTFHELSLVHRVQFCWAIKFE